MANTVQFGGQTQTRARGSFNWSIPQPVCSSHSFSLEMKIEWDKKIEEAGTRPHNFSKTGTDNNTHLSFARENGSLPLSPETTTLAVEWIAPITELANGTEETEVLLILLV